MKKKFRAFALFVLICVTVAAATNNGSHPARKQNSKAEGITREQADAILDELRQIHRLLENNSRVITAPARPAEGAPRAVQMKIPPTWYSIGRDDAPVTIVEFTDYQCPFCRRFHTDTFPELKKEYIDTGKVRFVTRDLPLEFHPNALPAAEAARCAGEQNKFWELREALISHASDLALESIYKYSEEIGANVHQLRTCVESNKYRTVIQQESEDASKLGVTGTPSFLLSKTTPEVLHGDLIVGARPLAVFDSAIKHLLLSGTPAMTRDPGTK